MSPWIHGISRCPSVTKIGSLELNRGWYVHHPYSWSLRKFFDQANPQLYYAVGVWEERSRDQKGLTGVDKLRQLEK